MIEDIPRIDSFKELMNEISYSWEYPNHDIIKHPDGNYSLNKLYIEPEQASYKMNRWALADGVFQEFECFYNLLVMLERGPK